MCRVAIDCSLARTSRRPDFCATRTTHPTSTRIGSDSDIQWIVLP